MATTQTEDHPYHHGDLPEALLSAVAEIIDEGGSAANLSLREAARRAGVSHSAPAHHFGDKDGLLAAFCAQGFEILEAALTSAYREHLGAPAIDRMRAAGAAYVRFAIEHRPHFEVMFRSGLNKSEYEVLSEKSNGAFAALMVIVEEVQAEGLYADVDPEPLALYFWSFAHGLASLGVDGTIPHVIEDTPFDELAAKAISVVGR